MNKIVFDPSLHDDLIKLFSFFCLQIQKEFDMCQEFLEKILNQKQFVNDCVFLHQQCHSEMKNQMKFHKETIRKAYESLDNENQIQIGDGDLEKCGHILKIHKNGYVQYCNLHKYLHPHPDLMQENSYGISHVFVTKNVEQIIKERDYQSIYVIYQNYINKLYCLIKQLFYHNIHKNCEIKPIPIDDKNITELLNQMTIDKSLFKGKILYEHLIQSKNLQSDKKISYYYIKSYKYKQNLQ